MNNKVALVTGAGTGIGKACATALLQNGWHTIFAGRNSASLEEAIAQAGDTQSRALAVSCDVTDADQVETLFERIITAFGKLDFLFNNAGISGPAGSIDKISLEDWRATLAVNVDGAFNCAKAAFTTMRHQHPRGGRIVNNGSIAAHTPRPGAVPYTVTKHAITGLTKCLSLDGRPFNITCGQIDIGNVLTDMTVPMTQGMLQANGERKPEPTFNLAHVSDAILYMANLPLEANVQNMTIMASGMPFIGRG